MALFRKFFLKKTPDRLLEISDRVYGIMLALPVDLVRAGARFAGTLHAPRRILDFGIWLDFFLGKLYMSLIELEFGGWKHKC
jgi:hypothetical protein